MLLVDEKRKGEELEVRFCRKMGDGRNIWYDRSTTTRKRVDLAKGKKPTGWLASHNPNMRSIGGQGPVDRYSVFSPRIGFSF